MNLNTPFGSIFPCCSLDDSMFHALVFHFSIFHASVFQSSFEELHGGVVTTIYSYIVHQDARKGR